jgi:hypothetical protein
MDFCQFLCFVEFRFCLKIYWFHWGAGKELKNYDIEAASNFATFRVRFKKINKEGGSGIIF